MQPVSTSSGPWIALDMLSVSARAGSGGARAEITEMSLRQGGTAGARPSISDLFETERQHWEDHLNRAKEFASRPEHERKRILRETTATDRAVARIERRMAQMAKALSALGGTRGDEGARILSLYTSNGDDRVSIHGAAAIDSVYTKHGNDALSLSASYVDSIYTGSGHDAVAIEGDVVDSIYTDSGDIYEQRDGRHHVVTRSEAEALGAVRYRQSGITYGGNDAVAIKAKSARSIYTGGGRDAITVAADLVSSIYADEGDDTITLRAGMVSGIHGGAGNDVINVDARIGGSVRHTLQGGMVYTGETQTPYRRPDTVEERMALALSNYADIQGGAGDDVISVTVDEMMSVNAGAGNDTIHVGGGTVGIQLGAGMGHDVVHVGQGAEIVLQVDYGKISHEVDGDALIIRHAKGSLRIEGYQKAAAIGVAPWGLHHAMNTPESPLLQDIKRSASVAEMTDLPIKPRDESLAQEIAEHVQATQPGLNMLYLAPRRGVSISA